MPHTGPIPSASPWFVVAGVAGADQVLVIFIWFVVAAVLVLCGFYVAVAVRRWIQRDETVAAFTIQDLRDMRARGQINDQEFAAMRSALLAQLDVSDAEQSKTHEGTPPPKGEPPPPDDESSTGGESWPPAP